MKLKKLLKDISIPQIKGSKEIEITGICNNSKLVSPGNLFVAKKGRSDDGARHIPEALEAGAVAVLTDIFDPSLKEITQLISHDVNSIEALLAANYYQFASQQLYMVGITGTNGKTTTSFLIKHLLDLLDGPCGLIGSIEYIIGNQRYQATRTTPDVITNHKMLREMHLHGCRSCVMEVTSHALDQGRVQYIDFDTVIFTNLTQDHLDYHQDMESYCKAKNRLFRHLFTPHNDSTKPFIKTAVMNCDSPWYLKVVEGCQGDLLTYGFGENAQLRASDCIMTAEGTTFTVHYKGQALRCLSPLAGRYNVYNVLASIGALLARGKPLDKIIGAIASFHAVSGRLERVPNALGLNIYVDFAHSDDALANVLACLQEFKTGKLITVFGCGGDRDATKRPKMAKAAEAGSDFTIVTTDNPRTENPAAIAQQIVAGFSRPDCYQIELDRYRAIQQAIHMASPADTILIAGKGHETYQIFANRVIEFDDRLVAAHICNQLHEELHVPS